MKWTQGEFVIDTDKAALQIEVIQSFLADESYWARERTAEQTRRAIENSICFGLYSEQRQIGFARVVSDLATFLRILAMYSFLKSFAAAASANG